MWLLFKVEALRQIRANKHALFKLDISSQRCSLKSNDLAGHTQSRGVPFAASVSNCISYNIRRIRFHLVVLAPKTVSYVPLYSAADSKICSNPEKAEPYGSLAILIIKIFLILFC